MPLRGPAVNRSECRFQLTEKSVVVDLPADTERGADHHPAVIASQAQTQQFADRQAQTRARFRQPIDLLCRGVGGDLAAAGAAGTYPRLN